MGVLEGKWGRGKARLKDCVDCGKQAWRWTQIEGTSGAVQEDYEPRCQECAWLHGGEPPLRGAGAPRGRDARPD